MDVVEILEERKPSVESKDSLYKVTIFSPCSQGQPNGCIPEIMAAHLPRPFFCSQTIH